MPAVCRRDQAFEHHECYVCDNVVKDGKKLKPSSRTWALGVLREEVFEGQGSKKRPVSTKDLMREFKYTKDDKEIEGEEPEVVIFNMGWKNFFNALAGFASKYGTVKDRDYYVTRRGKGTDTTYQIVPVDKDMSGDPNWEAYAEAAPDLEAEITQRASDEYYDKFFDVRHEQPTFERSEKQEGSESERADLLAMSKRAKAYS